MAKPEDKSENDVLSPGYKLDKIPNGRWMVRPILDVEVVNKLLKHHCKMMDETPLLSSLDSLNIAALYLKENGIDPKVLKPLIALHDALDDLSRGVENSLFDMSRTERGVARQPGKRQTRSYAYNMAMAAAAVTLSGRGYMGDSSVRAAHKIGMPTKTLEAYRKNISNGRIKDKWSCYLYNFHVNQLSSSSPEEKRNFGKGIIDSMLSKIRSA